MKRKNQNRHLDSALGLSRPTYIVAKNGLNGRKTAVFPTPIYPFTQAPCPNSLVADSSADESADEADDEVWHPPLLSPLDIVNPRDLKK